MSRMSRGDRDSGLAALSQPPFGKGQAPFPKGFHPYLGLTQVRQVGGAVVQYQPLDQIPGGGSGTISKADTRHQLVCKGPC